MSPDTELFAGWWWECTDIIRYIHLGRAVQHKPVHGLSCIRTGALQGPPFFEPLDLLDLLDLAAHSFLPTLNHVLFGTHFEILPDSIRQGTPRCAKHHMNEIPIWGWIMDQVTYMKYRVYSLEEADIQPFEGEPFRISRLAQWAAIIDPFDAPRSACRMVKNMKDVKDAPIAVIVIEATSKKITKIVKMSWSQLLSCLYCY